MNCVLLSCCRAMDVANAREELALRRKHRRMVSDMASKNRRQGKIKSRKYDPIFYSALYCHQKFGCSAWQWELKQIIV